MPADSIPSMKRSYRQYCLLLLMVVLAVPVLRAQDAEQQARSDVEYLASPALKGRGYLFGGHTLAASYIRERFQGIGLDTLPGGHYQHFTVRVNEFPAGPVLRINGVDLVPGRQFLPDGSSGSGTSIGNASWVRAGSGLVVPQRGYNDFQGRYPRGIMAVIDEAVPETMSADTTISRSLLALPTRVNTAAMLGASAVIVRVERLTHGSYGEPVGIPVFKVLRDALPDSIASIYYSVRNSYQQTVTQNVIGYIRGRRYPDRFLLLCAHYDHLGAFSSVYFPGANDNASGVAMLLSLAQHFKDHPPEYSVAFVAFSGEEIGLLGSQYFAEHPPLDLSAVRFVLNMDMAASGKDGITAVGGAVFGDEFALLQEAANRAGVYDVRKRENAPNSDHYPIVSRGVPGFYVYPFTGLQPYHHIDDRPETLQWDVFMRLRTIVLSFLDALQQK